MPTEAVAAIQRKIIVTELDRRGTPVGAGPGRAGEPPVHFLFREGYIVVRDEYLEQVRRLLSPPDQAEEQPEPADKARDDEAREGRDLTAVVQGVQLLRVPGWSTLDAVERVRGRLGAGVAAPDHVVSITSGEADAGHCPATEPEPVPLSTAPFPGIAADSTAGAGIRVVVVDTGYDADSSGAHPWLHGVWGDPDPNITPGTPTVLGPYAGHGTFIAGVIRAMAPAAEVIVRAGFGPAGATYESDLVKALDTVLTDDYPDVISMSAGTWTWDATGPLCFQVFQETRLRHHKGVVLVAAAGNDSARRSFWPAAAPWTVSVGALSSWSQRALFSNFGGWVDVYAPGENLINAYPSGQYIYHEPPRTGSADFVGLARWSGTSFATPLVAGLIAARMSRTGENGQTAAAALLAQAQSAAVPGVGAVLLPDHW